MTRRSPIIRGLNITDVVSGRTLQRVAVPHLRKQAAWCMGRITRSCTSGQNGATGISIMAFRLRFPGLARLSSPLQGNAYQSGRVSIKALNPSTHCEYTLEYRHHYFRESKATYYKKRQENNDELWRRMKIFNAFTKREAWCCTS